MKNAARIWIALVVGWMSLPALGDVTRDGGRDVSVLMFSTRRLHAVTLTPMGSNAWIAKCRTCAHTSLGAAMRVSGKMDVFAGGSVRVVDEESKEERGAAGLWHVRAMEGEVEVVLTLPSERYVAAVLHAEAAADEPAESLRALAIVARTYALNGRHSDASLPRSSIRPSPELCDSTQCQAMRLGAVPDAIAAAVRETSGESLWFEGRRAEVYFSQHCGGVTEDVGAVWPRLRGLPYMSSHADPHCVRKESAAWHAEVTLAELASIARAEGWKMPVRIVAVRVVARSRSRRVLRVAFEERGLPPAFVDAGALRFAINRALGWNRVRSDLYDVAVRNGVLVFDGRGHGHGVGLCQVGAAEMAVEHKNAREILQFYFAGTEVRVAPGDRGWVETRTPSLRVRGVEALSQARAMELERSWKEAMQRFPARRVMVPEILFAPSTELFRQMTLQPGWALGSTRGAEIVLQPEIVLRAHGNDARATVLHEMLHVLVEAEANERTPLWLREGLVEELARGVRMDGTGLRMGMNAVAIDAALMRADSLLASEKAHRAAAMRVHALVSRYGMSVVRGWLSSGVPANIA